MNTPNQIYKKEISGMPSKILLKEYADASILKDYLIMHNKDVKLVNIHLNLLKKELLSRLEHK